MKKQSRRLSYKQKYELLQTAIAMVVMLKIFVPLVAESICK